jgi:hypothetical protein
MYGVDNEAIHTLDDGNKRKLSDALCIRGDKIKGRVTSIESAIKTLYKLRDCFTGDISFRSARGAHAPTSELIHFLDGIPDFKFVSEEFHKRWTSNYIEKIMPISSALPMFYLFHDIHPEAVSTIFQSLNDGLPTDGKGKQSPVFHMMRKVSYNKENQLTTRIEDFIDLFIWTLRETIKGNGVNRMPTVDSWQFKHDFEGRLRAKQKLQRVE